MNLDISDTALTVDHFKHVHERVELSPRASASDPNECSLRHSSRNLPAAAAGTSCWVISWRSAAVLGDTQHCFSRLAGRTVLNCVLDVFERILAPDGDAQFTERDARGEPGEFGRIRM
jgi:hypothetical protein